MNLSFLNFLNKPIYKSLRVTLIFARILIKFYNNLALKVILSFFDVKIYYVYKVLIINTYVNE